MKAIILSAGQGRRLLPLTQATPKCSLPIRGRSILGWQLHEIAQCDVDEVVVVTGFQADVVDAIADENHGVPVRTLHNPFYANCDNLGTCWVARHEMTEPFILMNGDTLFEAAIMQQLLESDSGKVITLAADHKDSYDDDDMKIVSESGVLLRVGKTLDTRNVNAESIGMMKFSPTGARTFTDKVSHLMRYDTGMSRWYLSAIDELAQDGHVGVCSIHGLSWCEVDDRADLAHAETVVSQWSPGGSQVFDSVSGPGPV